MSNPALLLAFLYKLLAAAGLAWGVAAFYVRFGGSLTDRRTLARQFLLLTLTTLLIINVVKTSVALSLGLVGALSIIRFRTAIKEPEELGYLFLCVAIGLAVGAGYTVPAVAGTAVIFALLATQQWLSGRGRADEPQLFLTITGPAALAEPLRATVTRHFPLAALRRLDAEADSTTLAWLIPPTPADTLLRAEAELRALAPGQIRVAAVEQRNLLY